jgi:two-component system, NarL family, response regulator NreC
MGAQQRMAKLRILLADDHAVLRAGLKMLIDAQSDMVVIGEAGTGREAVRQVQECQADNKPDIVVMDISMPELDGTAATELITRENPEVRVLALTRLTDMGYLRRLLQAGVSGYILKKSAADELIHAIRIVARGGTYLDPTLAGSLVQAIIRQEPAGVTTVPIGELTEREEEILRAIAWGRSNKEIAAELGISVKTVEYHKANATEKLHLHSRTEILRYALAQGWLQAEEGLE